MELFRRNYIGSVTDEKGVVYMSEKGSTGVKVAEALADRLSEHTMDNGGVLPLSAEIRFESEKAIGPVHFDRKLLGTKHL